MPLNDRVTLDALLAEALAKVYAEPRNLGDKNYSFIAELFKEGRYDLIFSMMLQSDAFKTLIAEVIEDPTSAQFTGYSTAASNGNSPFLSSLFEITEDADEQTQAFKMPPSDQTPDHEDMALKRSGFQKYISDNLSKTNESLDEDGEKKTLEYYAKKILDQHKVNPDNKRSRENVASDFISEAREYFSKHITAELEKRETTAIILIPRIIRYLDKIEASMQGQSEAEISNKMNKALMDIAFNPVVTREIGEFMKFTKRGGKEIDERNPLLIKLMRELAGKADSILERADTIIEKNTKEVIENQETIEAEADITRKHCLEITNLLRNLDSEQFDTQSKELLEKTKSSYETLQNESMRKPHLLSRINNKKADAIADVRIQMIKLKRDLTNEALLYSGQKRAFIDNKIKKINAALDDYEAHFPSIVQGQVLDLDEYATARLNRILQRHLDQDRSGVNIDNEILKKDINENITHISQEVCSHLDALLAYCHSAEASQIDLDLASDIAFDDETTRSTLGNSIPYNGDLTAHIGKRCREAQIYINDRSVDTATLAHEFRRQFTDLETTLSDNAEWVFDSYKLQLTKKLRENALTRIGNAIEALSERYLRNAPTLDEIVYGEGLIEFAFADTLEILTASRAGLNGTSESEARDFETRIIAKNQVNTQFLEFKSALRKRHFDRLMSGLFTGKQSVINSFFEIIKGSTKSSKGFFHKKDSSGSLIQPKDAIAFMNSVVEAAEQLILAIKTFNDEPISKYIDPETYQKVVDDEMIFLSSTVINLSSQVGYLQLTTEQKFDQIRSLCSINLAMNRLAEIYLRLGFTGKSPDLRTQENGSQMVEVMKGLIQTILREQPLSERNFTVLIESIANLEKSGVIDRSQFNKIQEHLREAIVAQNQIVSAFKIIDKAELNVDLSAITDHYNVLLGKPQIIRINKDTLRTDADQRIKNLVSGRYVIEISDDCYDIQIDSPKKENNHANDRYCYYLNLIKKQVAENPLLVIRTTEEIGAYDTHKEELTFIAMKDRETRVTIMHKSASEIESEIEGFSDRNLHGLVMVETAAASAANPQPPTRFAQERAALPEFKKLFSGSENNKQLSRRYFERTLEKHKWKNEDQLVAFIQDGNNKMTPEQMVQKVRFLEKLESNPAQDTIMLLADYMVSKNDFTNALRLLSMVNQSSERFVESVLRSIDLAKNPKIDVNDELMLAITKNVKKMLDKPIYDGAYMGYATEHLTTLAQKSVGNQASIFMLLVSMANMTKHLKPGEQESVGELRQLIERVFSIEEITEDDKHLFVLQLFENAPALTQKALIDEPFLTQSLDLIFKKGGVEGQTSAGSSVTVLEEQLYFLIIALDKKTENREKIELAIKKTFTAINRAPANERNSLISGIIFGFLNSQKEPLSDTLTNVLSEAIQTFSLTANDIVNRSSEYNLFINTIERQCANNPDSFVTIMTMALSKMQDIPKVPRENLRHMSQPLRDLIDSNTSLAKDDRDTLYKTFPFMRKRDEVTSLFTGAAEKAKAQTQKAAASAASAVVSMGRRSSELTRRSSESSSSGSDTGEKLTSESTQEFIKKYRELFNQKLKAIFENPKVDNNVHPYDLMLENAENQLRALKELKGKLTDLHDLGERGYRKRDKFFKHLGEISYQGTGDTADKIAVSALATELTAAVEAKEAEIASNQLKAIEMYTDKKKENMPKRYNSARRSEDGSQQRKLERHFEDNQNRAANTLELLEMLDKYANKKMNEHDFRKQFELWQRLNISEQQGDEPGKSSKAGSSTLFSYNHARDTVNRVAHEAKLTADLFADRALGALPVMRDAASTHYRFQSGLSCEGLMALSKTDEGKKKIAETKKSLKSMKNADLEKLATTQDRQEGFREFTDNVRDAFQDAADAFGKGKGKKPQK